MRYDTRVTFYKDNGAKYDPRTSKHVHNYSKFTEWANVTDLGTQKQVELLGAIKQGTKTVRLLEPPSKWDYLQIEDSPIKYRFNSSIHVSKGYAMIVGEDNG